MYIFFTLITSVIFSVIPFLVSHSCLQRHRVAASKKNRKAPNKNENQK